VAESFVERLVGSIRRECLNHVLVLGEWHLRRLLPAGADPRCAGQRCADIRPIEPAVTGKIVQLPEVGGLHHRYIRQAA
jgi:putative transposase